MSINLVPPKIKKEQRLRKTSGQVIYFAFSVLLILIVFTAAIFIADRFLAKETEKIDQKISETNVSLKNYKDLEDNITYVNKKIDSLSKADSERTLWSNHITELANITPKNVQIKSLSLNSDSKKITLTGVASSRKDIAMLKDNMETSSKFKNVTFTSSTLEANTGSFTFNMSCEIEEIR